MTVSDCLLMVEQYVQYAIQEQTPSTYATMELEITCTASIIYQVLILILAAYFIHFMHTGPPLKAEIVFPPSDMDYVDIPYTDNELIESEGIIHLCLIQPYTSSSSIKYKSANNRTVSSTATTTASLSPSGALLLEAKLLSDGLLYFVRVMENKRDMDKVIRRTVEGGVFTCAVNKKNKVSFKLNLTAAQHSRSRAL